MKFIIVLTIGLFACSGPEGSKPGQCADNTDNDDDGKSDCDDSDCAESAECKAKAKAEAAKKAL